ncbi:MAG: hypothetical protein LUD18_05330 [Lachnospiraceae bacterium]|nr:hypothetical protein [Lachnospiraceae bacterium]
MMRYAKETEFHFVERISEQWKRQETERGICFSYPVMENAKGFYPYGFVQKNDSAADLAGWYGFQIKLAVWPNIVLKTGMLSIQVKVDFADQAPLVCAVNVPVSIPNGSDAAHLSLDVPLKEFPLETVRDDYWQFVTAVTVELAAGKPDVSFDDIQKNGSSIKVLSLCACRDRFVSVEIPVRGKSGEAGESILYDGVMYNCTSETVGIRLFQKYEGWEAMEAEFVQNPSGEYGKECEFLLPGYSSRAFRVRVIVPLNLAPGGHEETVLCVSARDGRTTSTQTVRLETMRSLPHPYIYHNREGWREVAEKIRRYPCYQPAYQEYLSAAEQWEVHPPLAGKDYCYYTEEETGMMSAAYAYAFTGKREYAEKIALFFRYFTDEEDGYPARKRGCSQSYVQEGHYFQHLAIPYDIIADAGVMTGREKAAVEKSFRLYMDILDIRV